jgi:uncharacterized protein YdaU (DUF1376 family)
MLLERGRQVEAQALEPSVLDYVEFRNQQGLDAWHRRRVEHELARLSERREAANAAQ